MNTAIYARYSTDHQRPESIEDQVNSCRKYAAEHDLQVREAHIYCDQAVSGTRKDRPALEELVDAAERNRFSAVLVDDLSRLARDNHLMLTLLAKMHSHGIKVVSVADQLDSENEEARLGIQIRGIFNELQVQDLRKKTLRGMLGQKERGYSAGEGTFGYQSVPVGTIKVDRNGKRRPDGYALEVDPEQAKVVRQVFESYAEGNSVLAIVKTLNQENALGCGGQAKRWGCATIGRMLDNEKYVGKWVWNKTGSRRDPYTGKVRTLPKPESSWVVRNDESLRIIFQDLWLRVRERRQQVRCRWPGRKGANGYTADQRGKSNPYPANLCAGLLACYVCGGGMSLVSGKRGGYFGCTAAARKACTNRKLVRRSVVEERILDAVFAELSSQENFDYLVNMVVKELQKSQVETPQLLAGKKQKLKAQERRVHNMVEFVANGTNSNALREAIQAAETKIAELTADIHGLEQRDSCKGSVPSADWISQRMLDVKRILECRAAEAAPLLGKLLGQVVMRWEEGSKPGYVAHASCNAGAALTFPLACDAKGSNAFQWRPRQDSNL